MEKPDLRCKTSHIGVEEFCPGIMKFLNEPGTRGKGITSMEFVDIYTKDFQVTGRLLMLRSGTNKDHIKRGVAINFCPFCGTDVITSFREANEKKVAEETAAKRDAKLHP